MTTPAEHPDQRDHGVRVPEVGLRTTTVLMVGVLAWAVVLAVLLLVPGLPGPGDGWWVWVPVAGMALGILAHLGLRAR